MSLEFFYAVLEKSGRKTKTSFGHRRWRGENMGRIFYAHEYCGEDCPQRSDLGDNSAHHLHRWAEEGENGHFTLTERFGHGEDVVINSLATELEAKKFLRELDSEDSNIV